MAQAGVAVLTEIELDHDLPVADAVIAKPLRGFGSRNQHVLRRGEVPSAVAPGVDRSSHLWQRYVEGATEFSVDFAIDGRGRISPMAPRVRSASFGGFSILGRSATDHARLCEQARHTAEWIGSRGGRGGFNIQFLECDQELRLIDVNARFGTSSALSLEMGVNLPAWLLGDESAEPRGDLKLFRYITQASAPAHSINVKGIVFDLDDTLIDQKDWILSKLRMLHAAFGQRLPPAPDFLAAGLQIIEEGNRSRLIDGLIAHFALSAAMRDELIPAYRTLVPERIRVFPDVEAVLAELKRRGIRIALLSDNPAASQRQKLERLERRNSLQFDAIVLTDEAGISKPDPRAFRQVAGALRIEESDLAMVGDNLFRDSLAALRAGFAHAFLVRRPGTFYSFSPDLAVGIAGSERVRWIDDLHQLLWHFA